MTNDESRMSDAAGVHDAIERFLFMAIKAVESKGGDVTFQATASTESIDRHGDMIKSAAFEKTIKPFLRDNPVLLAAHMHRSGDGTPTVIGSVTDLVIMSKRVEMAGVITGATALGREWGALVRDRHVRAVSIGFIPLAAELDGEILPGKTVEVFTEIVLLEISLVAVPANAEALIRAMGRHVGVDQGAFTTFTAERFDPGFDGRFKALETAIKTHLNELTDELAEKVVDRLVAAGILEDHEADALPDGRGGDGEARGVGTADDDLVGPEFDSKDIRAACALAAGVAHEKRN